MGNRFNQLGKKIGQDREMQMRARTKVIDVLWIMIPLMFLVAAVTFWATRQYGGVQDRDAVRKEIIDDTQFLFGEGQQRVGPEQRNRFDPPPIHFATQPVASLGHFTHE